MFKLFIKSDYQIYCYRLKKTSSNVNQIIKQLNIFLFNFDSDEINLELT